MDFVTMLAPLLGLAFLIERIVEASFNVLEQLPNILASIRAIFTRQSSTAETVSAVAQVAEKSSTSATAKAKADAAAIAVAAAMAAPDDLAKEAKARVASEEAATAKAEADKASAEAATKAANAAARKQVLTLIVSVGLGTYLANRLEIPLLMTSTLPGDVSVPGFLRDYNFAGIVAGVLSPYAHQILEALLNLQKLWEQEKKRIAGDVTST